MAAPCGLASPSPPLLIFKTINTLMEITLEQLFEEPRPAMGKRETPFEGVSWSDPCRADRRHAGSRQAQCPHGCHSPCCRGCRPRLSGPSVVLRYTNDAPTGYEAYWIVRADARSVKRQMCGIEDFHPLGRLFDLDVIQSDATPLAHRRWFRAAPLLALRSGGPLVHAQSYPHAGGDPPAHRRDGERV